MLAWLDPVWVRSARELVILDRDGVINHDRDDYVRSADQWIPLPGSIKAIAALSQVHYGVAVATNQSGLAHGYFTSQSLQAMHEKLLQLTSSAGGGITAIAYCPHDGKAACHCRKPQPGLVHELEVATGLSAKDAYFVGDKLSDLQAAQASGCRPVLVRTGKGRQTEQEILSGTTLHPGVLLTLLDGELMGDDVNQNPTPQDGKQTEKAIVTIPVFNSLAHFASVLLHDDSLLNE